MMPIPTAPRLPVVGSLPYLRFGSSDFLLSTGRRLGDTFWLHLGTERVLIIGHPEAASRVLENIDGCYPDKGGAVGFRRSTLPFVGAGLSTWNATDSEWRRRRSAAARIFRQATEPLTWSLPKGEVTGTTLRRTIELQVVRNLAEHFLGVAVDPHTAGDVVNNFRALNLGFWTGKLPWAQPLLAREARRRITHLEEIADRWIETAPATAPIRRHLPDLGPDRVRDEVLSQLLSVGTLAIPVEWALRLLATHQKVQTELRSQLLAGKRNSLLLQVVREALRLCPSTYWIQRRAGRDNDLASARVPAGTVVVVHVPSVHRHPDFWPDPDAFLPERFASQQGWKQAWMPFGRAARLCVAQHYSIDIMASVIAAVAGPNLVTSADGDEPSLGTGMNLVPKAGALRITPF